MLRNCLFKFQKKKLENKSEVFLNKFDDFVVGHVCNYL